MRATVFRVDFMLKIGFDFFYTESDFMFFFKNLTIIPRIPRDNTSLIHSRIRPKSWITIFE